MTDKLTFGRIRRQLLALALIVFVASQNAQLAFAQTGVRDTLSKIGTGEKARVSVRLRDKTVIKGYVVRVENTGFVLKETPANQERTLDFNEVESVKKAGKSTGKKVAIWSAVGIGVLAAVFAIGAKATSGGIHSH